MEKYIPILTLSSQPSADIACDILESSGISVLIEHVQSDAQDPLFKIHVQERFQERAIALTVGSQNEPISTQRTRARRYSGEWMLRQKLLDAA